MSAFILAFADELQKIAAPVDDGTVDSPVAAAAPALRPAPTYHRSTGAPMTGGLPRPSNAGGGTGNLLRAIPVQEMRSPPRTAQTDYVAKEAPGYKPSPAKVAPAAPKGKGGGGSSGPRKGEPLRHRKPFEPIADYRTRDLRETVSRSILADKQLAASKPPSLTPQRNAAALKAQSNPMLSSAGASAPGSATPADRVHLPPGHRAPYAQSKLEKSYSPPKPNPQIAGAAAINQAQLMNKSKRLDNRQWDEWVAKYRPDEPELATP